MESRTRISASNSSHRSEGEGQSFCFCGLPSPRRISWTQMNPRRRFYGCARYKEGSKCKYFKWVDTKFSHRATYVVLTDINLHLCSWTIWTMLTQCKLKHLRLNFSRMKFQG
ncbi:hypothetical protein EUGRSUZ_A00957 [Eucalyptus grandis]|uniref:Uncharacterized protein n=2 Tax=Eucalyptus grandis TaxID=71139 RepID=A0ACC3M0C3_EUCGR|nr:hypothetical protein EUGRSUZ_A00957 [Eucalyptus grandis]